MIKARLTQTLLLLSRTWGGARLAGAFLLAWIAGMIAVPIVLWVLGPTALPWTVSATVLLQLTAVLATLWSAWTPAEVARMASIIVVGAWFVEYFGSHTGWLFSVYDYTNLLHPQIGHVPLLVPLAWLMMLPTAWAVSNLLTGRTRGPAFVFTSALAFTAWDLFLDPQMVAWGAWTWAESGGYYGIPWHNFAGWILSASLLTALAQPRPVPVRPLLVIYTVTWVLQTIGLGIFWNAPGPALWGFLGMGVFVILCWQVLIRTQSTPQRLPA